MESLKLINTFDSKKYLTLGGEIAGQVREAYGQMPLWKIIRKFQLDQLETAIISTFFIEICVYNEVCSNLEDVNMGHLLIFTDYNYLEIKQALLSMKERGLLEIPMESFDKSSIKLLV